MHVLIHSYFYDPEPLPKPHELAVGLAERGHEVSVITSIPNYPQGSFYSGYKLRMWQWEARDGIRIMRLPLFPDHSQSGLRRMLSYSSFLASSALLGPFGAGKPDVMYVWHPPLTIGLSAWLIGLFRSVPFVYDVRDLWPEAIAATGMMSSRPLLNLLGVMERFVYRRASAICVVSPGYKKNLVGKGVPPKKIHIFSDWANGDIYRPVPRNEALAQESGFTGHFNVLFAGNMGAAQALETVIHTAKRLSYLPEIQFIFVGDGIERPRLESLAAEQGLKNVRFLGRQPVEQMPHLYALSDVLLAHFRRDPIFEISVPSKLFAYLACQRPVLMASQGDAAEIVRQAGAGITCDAEDPDALAEAVLKLYNMNPRERDNMGISGRQAFLERYSQEVLVRQHEEVLKSVAGHSGDMSKKKGAA